MSYLLRLYYEEIGGHEFRAFARADLSGAVRRAADS